MVVIPFSLESEGGCANLDFMVSTDKRVVKRDPKLFRRIWWGQRGSNPQVGIASRLYRPVLFHSSITPYEVRPGKAPPSPGLVARPTINPANVMCCH